MDKVWCFCGRVPYAHHHAKADGCPKQPVKFSDLPFIDEIWVETGIGSYEVSNYGRVVNARTGKDIRPYPDKHGQMRVGLYWGGKRHYIYVRRLVAKAFFLNYVAGIEVSHLNGNKEDNTIRNLTLGRL